MERTRNILLLFLLCLPRCFVSLKLFYLPCLPFILRFFVLFCLPKWCAFFLNSYCVLSSYTHILCFLGDVSCTQLMSFPVAILPIRIISCLFYYFVLHWCCFVSQDRFRFSVIYMYLYLTTYH